MKKNLQRIPDIFKDKDAWGKWLIDTSMEAILSCLPDPAPERIRANRREKARLDLEIQELEKKLEALQL